MTRLINLFRFPVLFTLAFLLSAVLAAIGERVFSVAEIYAVPAAFLIVSICLLFGWRRLNHLWFLQSRLSVISTAALLSVFAVVISNNENGQLQELGPSSDATRVAMPAEMNDEAEAVKQAKLEAEAAEKAEEAHLGEQLERLAKEERRNRLLETQTTMTEVRGALSISKTEAQRVAAWKGLKGRYVEARGRVREINEIWGNYTISIEMEFDDISVECLPSDETKAGILRINKGSAISCNGLLDDYTFIEIWGGAHTSVSIKQE